MPVLTNQNWTTLESSQSIKPSENSPGLFPTTRWSLISSARANDSAAQEALAELCQTYRYPIFAYVRRTGKSEFDSEDLTQGFIEKLLASDGFAQADKSLGKLRSFLLTSLKRFLTDAHREATAKKRGGGVPALSIEHEIAEKRYRNEPNHELTPDLVFERRWAATLLETVMNQLRDEFASRGKLQIFEALESSIPWKSKDRSAGDIAAELGIGLPALRMQLFYIRTEYGKLFRKQVADTVQCESEVDEEIEYLRKLFSE